jgi:hypothetical protein
MLFMKDAASCFAVVKAHTNTHAKKTLEAAFMTLLKPNGMNPSGCV